MIGMPSFFNNNNMIKLMITKNDIISIVADDS